MPPVLAGTAVLEKTPGNLGQAKGIVKLPIGEKSSLGSDLGTQASVDGRNRPVNGLLWIHPPGDTGTARCDDGLALILIAETPKQAIKLEIYLGNPGLIFGPSLTAPIPPPSPLRAPWPGCRPTPEGSS